MFIDRTKAQNDKALLHKILAVQNLGIYYKPNEYNFISEIKSEEGQLEKLREVFPVESRKIVSYKDDYLLEPMELITKMKIDPVTYKAQINLDIRRVDMCMKKM
jgi:hypothetical protein